MKKENIDTSWLNDIHVSISSLMAVSSRLEQTANAFHLTGNGGMCSFLAFQSSIIEEDANRIHKAIGTMLSNDVQKGQKQIAEIFKTLAKGLEEKDGKLETSGQTETSIHGERRS